MRFGFRVRVVRTRVPRRSGALSRRARVLGTALAAAGLMVGVSAPATADSPTGTFTATLQVVGYSLTVSPATGDFGQCRFGSSTPTALGFPRGQCHAPIINFAWDHITITNTGAPGHVYVQAGDAVPADAGKHWTTCAPNNICFGQDQFGLDSLSAGKTGVSLTTASQCDTAFSAGCAAASGASANEAFQLDGPSSSTDPSSTFTISVTYTAGA